MTLSNTTSEIIREISKKDKSFGLSKQAWVLIIPINIILMEWIPILYFFGAFISSCAFCYIAEFFDDDFFKIMILRLRIYLIANTKIFYP